MTMSDRRKAQKFIEAADQGLQPSGASGELAALLGAVELLRESAPPARKPDPAFASALRTNLVARYDELAGAEEKTAAPAARSRALRWAWVAAPAIAAAAALVLVLILGVFKTPAPPAVATLKVSTGKAVVVDSNGKSRTVTRTSDIARGQSIRVGGRSRAALTFKNKNIARLEAGTSLKIDGYGTRSVSLALGTGKVYNRVVSGTSYRVVHAGISVRAAGTAFDVEAAGRGLLANVFEGAVKVSWTGSQVYDVGQGAQAIVTSTAGGLTAEVRPIDLATLDFSWLAYNRDLDLQAGFPLGILENLAPTPPQGVQPPALAPAPGQTAPTTPQTSPATTPGSTPVTQPTTPQGQPSASMSLGGVGPPVTLSWTGTNVGAADSVVVMRSPGGPLA
ncbi:MAG: FecR domain-containing protein, partial [Candidatus Geothermincolia bacterium]